MKVQLIVVQGKPEGKVIPLIGPTFRVGRGETCHLRPSSEQVSREHAEFTVTDDTVTVKDLGSRNGTLVNGKALTGTSPLKDRDLVQIGPLTFAVAIEKAAAVTAAPAASGSVKAASPDDVSHDDIESWLVSDSSSPPPARPSEVYGGDTVTVSAFKNAPAPGAAGPSSAPAPAVSKPEPEPEAEEEEDIYDRLDDEGEEDTVDEEAETITASPEDFIDESNPFYQKKKAPEAPSKKQANQDSSSAAGDILRKLMDRKRGPR